MATLRGSDYVLSNNIRDLELRIEKRFMRIEKVLRRERWVKGNRRDKLKWN